ncbi:hypothetical protein Q428_06925 [Fervidicella metallireducens AeB]|uniref:Uncharacterized protein n=2 Tax=Fervidicella TaxID=1403538 RepID=A0A017RV87_9CLOT|nr:hypothetical protein Q428_06925 [Fervidicella metallireducens AeB]
MINAADIAKVKQSILYSYPSVKYFNEFFNMRSLLLNSLDEKGIENILSNEKSGVQSELNKVIKNLMGDREVIDGLKEEHKVLPDFAQEIVSNIKVEEVLECIYASFPLSGLFDIVQKGYRSCCIETVSVTVSPDSRFQFKNDLLTYGKEKYSIAFKGKDFWIAFSLVPSDEGRKGTSKFVVIYVDNNSYIVDDVDKYIDASLFKKNTSV